MANRGATLRALSISFAKIVLALAISFGWFFVSGSIALLALTAFAFAH
jgi:hypothetical protein